ncbi:MAG: nucleotidyl transferase AbiEii/AbiGii toxin family protein [Micropruina sp.]|uniref:nucleotidyl transferase AbiEii/AbiGii toxin family protein n=1 Tax=Micropruina sp. TaxID=2737536 RepID=UPI0039E282B8
MTASTPEFFSLAAEEQREAYRIAADEQGRRDDLVEKDLWVVWALDALFATPGVPHMAFKGGTSLSKVFNAIQRFSEDIDVTLNAVELAPDQDVYPDQMSSKARRRMESLLRERLAAVLTDIVVPHLRARAADLPVDVTISDVTDGDIVWVRYPTVASPVSDYLRSEGVKIEFGGRNAIDPSSRRTIRPYLAHTFPELTLPTADVDVLSPERTFWEKFTLAHAESRRAEFKTSERLSRHWYDLARLADQDIAEHALADRALLEDVVKIKNLYFRTAYAEYELCLTGNAALLPDSTGLQVLRRDYEQMLQAQMIDEPLDFDAVTHAVQTLQDRTNVAMSEHKVER